MKGTSSDIITSSKNKLKNKNTGSQFPQDTSWRLYQFKRCVISKQDDGKSPSTVNNINN